jgi:beta-N-acetylhexosaminidase
MSALGINLNLAPVAEYLNNENRDFLENRSYGSDPDFTAQAAAAFIVGMEQAGIRCVVKHFPGSAGPDPHRFPSVLTGDKAALAGLVSPIAALIRGGQARAIMVSHSAVPAWDSAIASLSPAVMGIWLRQELGFDGLIICDDFSMASAGGQASAEGHGSLNPENAAVLSLAAGADMVLVWPPDLRRTHRAIMAALDDGRLPRERLRKAAERIIFEKVREMEINER